MQKENEFHLNPPHPEILEKFYVYHDLLNYGIYYLKCKEENKYFRFINDVFEDPFKIRVGLLSEDKNPQAFRKWDNLIQNERIDPKILRYEKVTDLKYIDGPILTKMSEYVTMKF